MNANPSILNKILTSQIYMSAEIHITAKWNVS